MGKSVKTPIRSKQAGAASMTQLVAALSDAVRSEGAIAKKDLRKRGVPPSLVLEVLTALEASGFEVTGRLVRVPVVKQLGEQLEASKMLPLRSLESVVVGASKREVTIHARELVDARRARFIVRSSEVALATADTHALSERELETLERAVAGLHTSLKIARRKSASLLRGDVEQLLRPFTSSIPKDAARTPPQPPKIRESIEKHRESSGLTWVPKLVRALGGAAARDVVHAELLRGARAGELELRPDSGMGRLSAEDAALCLAGPQGSRLSWVRRIEASP